MQRVDEFAYPLCYGFFLLPICLRILGLGLMTGFGKVGLESPKPNPEAIFIIPSHSDGRTRTPPQKNPRNTNVARHKVRKDIHIPRLTVTKLVIPVSNLLKKPSHLSSSPSNFDYHSPESTRPPECPSRTNYHD